VAVGRILGIICDHKTALGAPALATGGVATFGTVDGVSLLIHGEAQKDRETMKNSPGLPCRSMFLVHTFEILKHFVDRGAKFGLNGSGLLLRSQRMATSLRERTWVPEICVEVSHFWRNFVEW
jgi:hypothetical protein